MATRLAGAADLSESLALPPANEPNQAPPNASETADDHDLAGPPNWEHGVRNFACLLRFQSTPRLAEYDLMRVPGVVDVIPADDGHDVYLIQLADSPSQARNGAAARLHEHLGKRGTTHCLEVRDYDAALTRFLADSSLVGPADFDDSAIVTDLFA